MKAGTYHHSKQIIEKMRAANLGKVSGMKGKHQTEEAKKKISEHNGKGMMGKHQTEEAKRKNSESHKGKIPWNKGLKGWNKGEKNPNWCGGLSFLPYCFRFNDELKIRVKERDLYTCQNCGELDKSKLRIHHIHYDKQNCYPDLITLCRKCNSKANYNRDYWECYFMYILKNKNFLNWR